MGNSKNKLVRDWLSIGSSVESVSIPSLTNDTGALGGVFIKAYR